MAEAGRTWPKYTFLKIKDNLLIKNPYLYFKKGYHYEKRM